MKTLAFLICGLLSIACVLLAAAFAFEGLATMGQSPVALPGALVVVAAAFALMRLMERLV